MHYYQHHIGDFIKDTANLNDHQLATYMRMIWAYYSEEKPFANEPEDIAFAMRSDEKTVSLILRHYFKKTDEGWKHGRCDREIAEFHTKKGKAAASANARWSNAKNSAKAMPSESGRNANALQNDANQEPRTKNQEPITTPRLVTEGGRKPETPAPLEIDKQKITPHGAMAIELSKRGVAITSMNPDLLDWIEKGVTIPQACEAVALARQKKPAPERISAGYLNTIMHGEIINPKQKKPSGPAWWTTDSATNAKAAEVGLTANRGEEMSQFRERIRAAMENKTRGVAA